MVLSRRNFLNSSIAASITFGLVPFGCVSEHGNQNSSNKQFFKLEKRHGRWWFINPMGNLNFSLGLNHIDPTSLRYTENADIWNKKYGNSMKKWLQEAVRKDLTEWGFNCVGWNREVVTREFTNHRHSRAFTFEEYQWLDLPYCHSSMGS